MYVPSNGERVVVTGRTRMFLVVWVDYQRQEADLIPLYTAVPIEGGVPFSALEAYRENNLPQSNLHRESRKSSHKIGTHLA